MISARFEALGYHRNEGFSKKIRIPWLLVSQSQDSVQARPFENRNFSPRSFSPNNLKFSRKSFSGKMFLGRRVSVESGFPEICLDCGISQWLRLLGILEMNDFPKIPKILWFLLSKSWNSWQINDFWEIWSSRVFLKWKISSIFPKSLIIG